MPDCPAADQILELGCKNLCWGEGVGGRWAARCFTYPVRYRTFTRIWTHLMFHLTLKSLFFLWPGWPCLRDQDEPDQGGGGEHPALWAGPDRDAGRSAQPRHYWRRPDKVTGRGRANRPDLHLQVGPPGLLVGLPLEQFIGHSEMIQVRYVQYNGKVHNSRHLSIHPSAGD